MQSIFQTLLYQPIFNAFVGLYQIIPDVGIVILVITLIIRFALYPLTRSSLSSQKALMELQPKIDELKEKYKDDQQKMAQEMMELYKENKVNPFASCLPLLIQLPVFLALFWVLKDGLSTQNFDLLYSFIPAPDSLNPVSLGFLDLSQQQIVLALLAGGAQFWQAKTMSRRRAPKKVKEGSKDENMLAVMNKQMLYVMPVITIIVGFQLPGGVTLYWFFSTLFMAVQQHFLFKKREAMKKKSEKEKKLEEKNSSDK